MTKIFFDHQKFSTQRYGGISRYFATILEEIKQQEAYTYQLGVLYSQNTYIRGEDQYLPGLMGKKLLGSERRAYLANSLYCRHLLDKNDFDVFHPTYYDPYFLAKLKKPMVTTIHDMTYERLPEYFWSNDPLTYQKRLSVERADQIIAISETTRQDLLNYTRVRPEQVKVIYHGIDLHTPLVYEEIPGLPENYLLYVGDRSGYKNFYLFMRAYAVVQHKYPGLKVVLTGGGPMGTGDTEFLKRLQLEEKVMHIQVSDAQLNYAYRKAALFVYPSLHEGFGLPILEAFKASCPVLLSDTDCFREIGAQGAAFFGPHDLEDLVFKIGEVLSKPSLSAALVAAGNTRLQDFPIDRCITRTLEVYDSLS